MGDVPISAESPQLILRRVPPPGRSKTNVSETLKTSRCCCGVATGYFATEIDHAGWKLRTGQKNLHKAQFWRTRAGYLSGGIVPTSWGSTNDGEGTDPGTTLPVRKTFESSAVIDPPPLLVIRRNCLPGQGEKPASTTHTNQAPPYVRRLRYLPGGLLSFRRNADQWWRYD